MLVKVYLHYYLHVFRIESVMFLSSSLYWGFVAAVFPYRLHRLSEKKILVKHKVTQVASKKQVPIFSWYYVLDVFTTRLISAFHDLSVDNPCPNSTLHLASVVKKIEKSYSSLHIQKQMIIFFLTFFALLLYFFNYWRYLFWFSLLIIIQATYFDWFYRHVNLTRVILYQEFVFMVSLYLHFLCFFRFFGTLSHQIQNLCIIHVVCFGLFWFYGISTFVGYLMPNLFLHK